MSPTSSSPPRGFWRQIWHGLALVVGRRSTWGIFLAFFAGWILLAGHPPATGWLERLLRDWAQIVAMGLREPTPNMAIVVVDSETLDSVPHRWPWPRSEYARLLRLLKEGHPRFIVFDILLQHLEGEKPSPGDEELAGVLRDLGNVALVSVVEQTLTPLGLEVKHFRNHAFFRGAALLEGFVWGVVDPDNQIRTFVLRDDRLGLESCVSQVAHRLRPDVRLWEGWWGGVVHCPIAFARNGGGIPVISAGDLLKGDVPIGILRDRVVLLGVSAPALHDLHRTCRGIVAGVDVLASELDTLLSGRGGLVLEGKGIQVVMAVLGLLLGMASMAWGGWLGTVGSLVGMVGAAVVLLVIGEWWYLHFPVAPLIASWSYVWLLAVGLGGFLEFLHSQFARVEAQAAAQVQQQIFPKGEWSSSAGYRCCGFCLPSEETGGDYFDFLPLPDGSLFFLIGDVSGHGIPAAMITTMAKTVTQVLAQEGRLTPEKAHATFSTALCHLLQKKKMVTMLLGHLDVRANELSLAFAGHLPPLLIARDGGLTEIACPSTPFGFTDKAPPFLQKVPFPPGATLVLYTDGIIEASNWDDQIYTFRRWYDFLTRAVPGLAFGDDPSGLLADVRAFSEGRPFADDVTLMLIQRKP